MLKKSGLLVAIGLLAIPALANAWTTVGDACGIYAPELSRGECLGNVTDYLDGEGHGSTVVNGLNLNSSKLWIRDNSALNPTLATVEDHVQIGTDGSGSSTD